jgi:hypothetical protein
LTTVDFFGGASEVFFGGGGGGLLVTVEAGAALCATAADLRCSAVLPVAPAAVAEPDVVFDVITGAAVGAGGVGFSAAVVFSGVTAGVVGGGTATDTLELADAAVAAPESSPEEAKTAIMPASTTAPATAATIMPFDNRRGAGTSTWL